MRDLYTTFATFTLPVKKEAANFHLVNTATLFYNDEDSSATSDYLPDRFKASDLNHHTLVIVGLKSSKPVEFPHLRIHSVSFE